MREFPIASIGQFIRLHTPFGILVIYIPVTFCGFASVARGV